MAEDPLLWLSQNHENYRRFLQQLWGMIQPWVLFHSSLVLLGSAALLTAALHTEPLSMSLQAE